jgi:mannitol/fructose-specific phosphotransferase system IIA component (Ntr-type)
MFLYEIFSTGKIMLHLKAEEKDEVFDELITRLAGTDHDSRKDEFLKVIRDRENIISTGFKDGIAIPHGRIDDLDGVIGVLGISDKGIEYGSLDNNPARIIFMFLSSKMKQDEHLAILKRISKISDNAGFRKDILLAKTPESANKILKEYETSLF